LELGLIYIFDIDPDDPIEDTLPERDIVCGVEGCLGGVGVVLNMGVAIEFILPERDLVCGVEWCLDGVGVNKGGGVATSNKPTGSLSEMEKNLGSETGTTISFTAKLPRGSLSIKLSCFDDNMGVIDFGLLGAMDTLGLVGFTTRVGAIDILGLGGFFSWSCNTEPSLILEREGETVVLLLLGNGRDPS
jgi:hypothetical protein